MNGYGIFLYLFLLFVMVFWVYKIIIPITKMLRSQISYKRSYKDYSQKRDIIFNFLKSDLSNQKLYQKEAEKFLEVLSRHISATTSREHLEETAELFNIFKDIIPEFKQEVREKKLKQILK